MMTRNVMKRKPENAAETADEKEPALKKRSCVNVKCKMELASDNKLPFLMVALIRKYGPKVGKTAFMALKAILKK